NISLAIAIGGSGGTGGTGSGVQVDNRGLLVTLGQSAYGVFGQSVGGGGGSGGGGDGGASSGKGETLSLAASPRVGGSGRTGRRQLGQGRDAELRCVAVGRWHRRHRWSRRSGPHQQRRRHRDLRRRLGRALRPERRRRWRRRRRRRGQIERREPEHLGRRRRL